MNPMHPPSKSNNKSFVSKKFFIYSICQRKLKKQLENQEQIMERHCVNVKKKERQKAKKRATTCRNDEDNDHDEDKKQRYCIVCVTVWENGSKFNKK